MITCNPGERGGRGKEREREREMGRGGERGKERGREGGEERGRVREMGEQRLGSGVWPWQNDVTSRGNDFIATQETFAFVAKSINFSIFFILSLSLSLSLSFALSLSLSFRMDEEGCISLIVSSLRHQREAKEEQAREDNT